MFNDLVGIIVENILFKTDVSVYDKIDAVLKNKGVTFTECYKNPQILLESLRYLSDDTRMSVVSTIKKELGKFEDEPGIIRFTKIISA
ncbi:MAG TPA: hypothetical protein VJ571_02820 [Candidatus Nitrosotalea sp.]|nr:hypothetical protein [Candidatus Nitrosotalea sp.]